MSAPYPEAMETLPVDFSNYTDFGFMDASCGFDPVLALPGQTSFYNNRGSFETHGGVSLQQQQQSDQFHDLTINLGDPLHLSSNQVGGAVRDDVGNWLQGRNASNMNSFMFGPGPGSNSDVSAYSGTFEKQQDCSDSPSPHSVQQQQQSNYDMGWNHEPLHQHSPLSVSSTSMVGDYTAFQQDMKNCSTSQPENSLSATNSSDIQRGGHHRRQSSSLSVTDGDIQRGGHRRQMSVLGIVGESGQIKRGGTHHRQLSTSGLRATEGDIQRGHRRHLSSLGDPLHQQLLLSGALSQVHHNDFMAATGQEETEPKDVSRMLLDLENKLVANLRKSPPEQIPLKQQNSHGDSLTVHHSHTGSWEESLTSDSTMVSSSPSSRRSGINAHNPIQSGIQFRETSASPPVHSGLQPINSGYSNQQERGVSLVNSLIGCADAVAKKDEGNAKSLLKELSNMVSPYGDSMQRVASYFMYGLVAHIAGTGSGPSLYRALRIKEPTATDTSDAFLVFATICPFMQFGEMAAAQTILEAFQGEEDVHWIDLGMVQGHQWLSFQLLQSLATRSGGPPKMIYVTGVQVRLSRCSSESLTSGDEQMARQLQEFAESLRLNFTFQPVLIERLEHLQPWMLTARNGQAVAVNCSAKLHTLLYDDGNCLSHVLSIIHNLRPKVFCVLEQEASHNAPVFLARFLEALHFYSAMFDSLDATLTRISPERAKVEQLWLGQEIINIVACEGIDRTERHERSQQWRSRMLNAGYRPVPLSELAVTQVKNLRSLSYGTSAFTIVEDRGTLILVWQDRPLFSSSVWTCSTR